MDERLYERLRTLARKCEEYRESENLICNKRHYFEERGSTEKKPVFGDLMVVTAIPTLVILLPAIIGFSVAMKDKDVSWMIAAAVFAAAYLVLCAVIVRRYSVKRKLWCTIDEQYDKAAARARSNIILLKSEIDDNSGTVPADWLYKTDVLFRHIESGAADTVAEAIKLATLAEASGSMTVIYEKSGKRMVKCGYCGAFADLSESSCPRCGAPLKP